MFSLAHLTDPHLPLAGVRPGELASKRILGWLSWTLRRRRRHARAVVEAVSADIAAARPDHVALTGDLVNISTRAEFAAAERWLAARPFSDALTLVPGNHDHYTADAMAAGLPRLARWMGKAEKAAPPAFPTVRYRSNIALIGLDSTFPAPWGEASGRLGEKQLRALAELLPACAAKGLGRVVLIHHPPLSDLASKPRKALKDADSLAAVLRELGAEVVLYGHNHVWEHRPMRVSGGTMHVLSAPSASMTPGASKPAGGWQMLRMTRRQGVWEIIVERRQIDDAARRMRALETLRLTSRDGAEARKTRKN